jgi:hypothetical protein
MADFYKLEAPEVPWGDYGAILAHGMTAHLPEVGGLLQLERTGPYVPPITFPAGSDIVVTAAARTLLEASGLTGFDFRRVIKARIVRSAWETWDRSAPEPLEYPESGEPEDYILGRPHDEVLAEALGELSEVDIAPSARVLRGDAVRLVAASWNGRDFFRAAEVRRTFVSERARRWLEETFPDHVSFRGVALA